ncbi:sirohydrochlorin chelatase [Candidatus Nitrosotenuis uzonensis]|uniref:Sirohydrochlorin cobaltochelatase n=1 Tax=Candidatus Nitrosotenuis uzonensis TaxID=1407055 RepID=V6AV94_9ARCH|nr:CbiX/SirB N-terminal domain-containing protein [Candidatus Nitrosotenuis uzonensis]CDI06535.1 Sirohydrochlorin cobaltochelatase [Candidatus Nitrosotenuis uzonensis]
MKRGLLIIDRGSKEDEVKTELSTICSKVMERGNYAFADYCFLEVVPPFIKDGIQKCLKADIDSLTIVPYFLYPGKKVKMAVNEAIKFQAGTSVKMTFTKPMSMHPAMTEIVESKIQLALKKGGIDLPDSKIDVLIIGHGSKDPNARISIQYVADSLRARYKSVDYCFLEIEEPTIPQGIEKCDKNKPEALAIVFYFLHEGAHVKRDIYGDLSPALEKSQIKKYVITEHIGTDEKMIDFIITRAREVEDAD